MLSMPQVFEQSLFLFIFEQDAAGGGGGGGGGVEVSEHKKK